MRLNRRSLLGSAAAASLTPISSIARAYELDEVRRRGVLRVAVYKNFEPFYYESTGRGIDIDIGEALAEALRVKMSPLPFAADESVDDDLRNMVWKGHYLGYGPADVMMHVPVAKPLMRENDRARIFAPYYREKLQIARRVAKIPKLQGLYSLEGHLVGTEDASLGSVVLLGVGGGRVRDSVRHYKSVGAAVDAMKAGKIDAVVGQRSELHAALKGAKGFAVSDARAPGVPPNGWVVGLSVKKSSEALAEAIDAKMKTLVRSGKIRKIFARYGVKWLSP